MKLIIFEILRSCHVQAGSSSTRFTPTMLTPKTDPKKNPSVLIFHYYYYYYYCKEEKKLKKKERKKKQKGRKD